MINMSTCRTKENLTPGFKKSKGDLHNMKTEKCQVFYPILVTHQISVASDEESVFLAKVAFKIVKINLGNCYLS
jgi:hypothetical protein